MSHDSRAEPRVAVPSAPRITPIPAPRESITFAAGGEIGGLAAKIDWSKTPLGPASGWSQSLRTMVGLLLRNRFPLILWWGPKLVQLYNDAYAPILGAKHPHALGQPAAECWAETWDVLGPMIEAPYRDEPATWSDDLLLMINRKGFSEETHFKVAYSPVPDESISPLGIGGVLGTVAEITQEVYAHRQLATLGALARQSADARTAEIASEMAARTLDANISDIPYAFIYLLDSDGKTARLVSASEPGDNGLEHDVPQSFSLEDDSALAAPFARVMRERRAEIISNLASTKSAREVGGRSAASAMVLPLASPGRPEAYGVLVVGVSAHRQLNEQYRTFFELTADYVATAIRNARAYQQERERAEKLAEVDRAKTAFFGNVSHEFRTPLTLMLGPLEEMRGAQGIDQTESTRIDLLQRNASRLLKLVNSLLSYARAEAGRVDAAFEPTDLSARTAELASGFRAAIEGAGIELVVDCRPLPEPIYIDHDMWEKIVLNLLSNAFKFTFEGSIGVRLGMRTHGVELEVSDSGTGIPPDEIPRLFERFHRIEGARSRSHEGTGIGLALVQQLVRLHGGEVRVTTEMGRGTTFTVSIPRGSAHLPPERLRTARPFAASAYTDSPHVLEALRWSETEERESEVPRLSFSQIEMGHQARERIVWADDNSDMREYVERLLAARWRVESVANGVEALAAIRRETPALVLCDVMMPHLDAYGLLRELRADPVTKTLPVILLSARAGEEATLEGLHAGANDYVVKPFSARELTVRVSSQLKIAALRDDVEHQREAGRRLIEQLFDDAPASIAVIRGSDLIIEFANARCIALWQRSSAAEVVGKPLLVALPELVGQGFDELLRQVMKNQQSHLGYGVAATIVRDGLKTCVRLNFVYVPTRGVSGEVDGVSVFAFDVTSEFEARERAQLGEEVGRALVTNEGLVDQLRHCCEALVRHACSLARVWTCEASADRLDLRATAGVEMESATPGARVPLQRIRIEHVAHTRKSLFIRDVHDHPLVPEQAWAEREGIVSFAGFPLIVGDRLVGVLALFAKHELSADTLTAIATVADQIAIGVDRHAAERFRELSIGMLAHDLRSPLSAVLSGAELARKASTDGNGQVLARVVSSAKRMDRMIAQVLDLTRARSGGGIPVHRTETDLRAICAQVVDELASSHPDRTIELSSSGDERGMWDADRMAQVFSNLLGNALAYGRRDLPIEVVLEATDVEVCFSVHNSGKAIPSELLPHLFDAFRRARDGETTVTRGLGLGLFISREIVVAHGGSIAVQSTGETGTRFTVTVPLRPSVISPARSSVASVG